MNYPEIAGWIGAIGLLLLFFLNLFNKISTDAFLYKSINFLCASLLVINAVVIQAFAFAVINALWAVASFVSLFKNKK